MPETTLRVLRIAEVKDRVGESTSTIYDKMSKGQFPRPIPLGAKSRGWIETEIDSYIKSKIAARDGGATKFKALSA